MLAVKFLQIEHHLDVLFCYVLANLLPQGVVRRRVDVGVEPSRIDGCHYREQRQVPIQLALFSRESGGTENEYEGWQQKELQTEPHGLV